MFIAGEYSFNLGREVVLSNYLEEFESVKDALSEVDASKLKTKKGEEITNSGRMLYSPSALNTAIRNKLEPRGWEANRRVICNYPTEFYTNNYIPISDMRGAYREMDFIKNKVGVEVQFGKYAFMVYNVAAKMTIFHKLKYIDVGIEIVPIRQMAQEMSTGVSYFEQFVWDLEHRGTSNIDIPVFILGIAPESYR